MMPERRNFGIWCCAALWGAALIAAAAEAPAPAAKTTPGTAEILAAAPASAWRPLADEHTLYMELPAGRVIIELDPALAPHTVANIEALVRMHWFDGAAVVRVQDNFVAQWSNPDTTRKLPDNLRTLAPEFTAPASVAPLPSCPIATATRRRWASSTVFRPRAIRRAAACGWRIATARSASGATTIRPPATAANCTRSSARRRASWIAT